MTTPPPAATPDPAAETDERADAGTKPLPCPFCGGRAWVMKGRKYKTGANVGEWMWKPEAGCQKCGFAFEGMTLAEAVSRWNTRVPDPVLADLLAACEAAERHLNFSTTAAKALKKQLRAAISKAREVQQ